MIDISPAPSPQEGQLSSVDNVAQTANEQVTSEVAFPLIEALAYWMNPTKETYRAPTPDPFFGKKSLQTLHLFSRIGACKA